MMGKRRVKHIHVLAASDTYALYVVALMGMKKDLGAQFGVLPVILDKKNERCNELRLEIKRSHDNFHTRILSNSNKKIEQTLVGDSILIPISRPDMMSSIAPRNMTGCIILKDNELNRTDTLGTCPVPYPDPSANMIQFLRGTKTVLVLLSVLLNSSFIVTKINKLIILHSKNMQCGNYSITVDKKL